MIAMSEEPRSARDGKATATNLNDLTPRFLTAPGRRTQQTVLKKEADFVEEEKLWGIRNSVVPALPRSLRLVCHNSSSCRGVH